MVQARAVGECGRVELPRPEFIEYVPQLVARRAEADGHVLAGGQAIADGRKARQI